MEHPSRDGFWWYVRERDLIRRRKDEGLARPWTEDATLSRFHFCNVRRADDYGTRWLAGQLARCETWKGITGRTEGVLWRSFLFRLIPNPEWWAQSSWLPPLLFGPDEWHDHRAKLIGAIRAAPQPYSKAYRVLQSRGGMPRVDRLIMYLDRLFDNLHQDTDALLAMRSLEHFWHRLQSIDGMGKFVALQVMRDFQAVGLLGDFNVSDFTYIGPGAARTLEELGFIGKMTQYGALYQLSGRSEWRDGTPFINIGDVQHSLCEYGKYCRWRRGIGWKRRYEPRV